MTRVRWSVAMRDALYGPGGFYRVHAPAGHFATSSQHPVFAAAIDVLIGRIDAALGHPDPLTVVDVGAGSGELLGALTERDRTGRLAPIAVDVRPRPAGLDARIAWADTVPEEVTGLVLACELLDVVPCDLAERDAAGTYRYQHVDPESGATGPGEAVDRADARWLERWWPLSEPGRVAAIGAPRDAAWTGLTGRLRRGAAVAIDYGHTRDTRPPDAWVAAFADGREVAPIPDGSRDLTVHVAMDSLGAEPPLRQREALLALGVDGRRPDRALAERAPLTYLRALGAASSTATLLDPAGLGGHLWTWRTVGVDGSALGLR